MGHLASRPCRLIPGTHCVGGWVAPRTGLKAVVERKILCLCRESNVRRPARNLSTILTELLELLRLNKCVIKSQNVSRQLLYSFLFVVTVSKQICQTQAVFDTRVTRNSHLGGIQKSQVRILPQSRFYSAFAIIVSKNKL
jgi:hypothetical protein